MFIEQYQEVVLKDGQTGCAVEVFEQTGFVVDIGNSPKNWDTIYAEINDIDMEETERLYEREHGKAKQFAFA
ncbi:hypothetical protein AGMMS49975_06910 [Clostridia bacterium]|nr:hypothetical protein AGMMS49975_06910 [Clostridia bacterium]